MSSIFIPTIQRILSVGRGPKVLLLSNSSSSILSNIIPHSTFLNHDFFLFEFITSKKRSKMANITCVCFLRTDNIQNLLDELKDPYYYDYIIMFTNVVPDHFLSMIADADVTNCVRGLYEVYIDVIQQQFNLFTMFKHQSVNNFSNFDDFDVEYVNRVCDGLYSLYRNLEAVPTIRVQNDSEVTRFIGTKLNNLFDLNESNKTSGTLLIVDRKCDLMSVLLYAWSFQAMVSEYLNYDNMFVQINDRNYSLDNEFFDNIKFMDINSASNEIRKYSKEKNEKISRGLIKNMTESSKKNEFAETYLTVYNNIITKCLTNKELSEIEYYILQSRKNEIKREQLNVIKDINVPYVKRLKILLIYLLRIGFNFKEFELNKLPMNEIVLKYPEFKADLLNFNKLYMENYDYSPRTYKFRNGVDPKLGYEPYIKTLIKSVYKEELSVAKYPFLKGRDMTAGNLIVYMVGGLTYNEYKAACECMAEIKNAHGYKLILVTDRMITYNDIMEQTCNKK